MGYLSYVAAGSNLSNRFECKEAESEPGDGVGGKERRGRGQGEGERERAKRMGEGLFVHASNSLGVISIARSIIVPFEEDKKNTETVRHCKASCLLENLKSGGRGVGSGSLNSDTAIFDFAILVLLKIKIKEYFWLFFKSRLLNNAG